MAEKKSDEKNGVIDKFNLVVDITSSFVKSIFPQTFKFVTGIKGAFTKKVKPPENKD